MMRWLAFRDLIGRLLSGWYFWVAFVAFATVRIYLDFVRFDEVDYRSRLIWSFFMALGSAWAQEACERQPPAQT